MARKIAILGGTGPEGSGLANRLARAGEHIVIGSRDAARAQETAQQLRTQIGGTAQIEGADNAVTRMIGVWQGSAAQAAAELLPEGVSIAAAFQNLGAELLAGDGPVDCDVLVCSDDDSAKKVAMELTAKIPGVRALNGGRLENARVVESITALLIGLNIRYKVHSAGIRFTGLPVK